MLSKVSTFSGTDHKFLRVDLYTNQEHVFFGELTFYPDSGFSQFNPSEIDEILYKQVAN